MLCEILTFVERSDWRSVFLQRLKVLKRNTGEGIDTQKSDIKKQNGPMLPQNNVIPRQLLKLPCSCYDQPLLRGWPASPQAYHGHVCCPFL